jgi:hypothetical protein
MKPVNRLFIEFAVVLGLSVAGIGQYAKAAESITAITGTQSLIDGACAAPIPFFTALDCSYNASNPDGFLVTGWQGPTPGAGYYTQADAPGFIFPPGQNGPPNGDNKYAIPLYSGSVIKIENHNDADCANDTIQGNIILSAGVRTFAGGPGTRGEEIWDDGDISMPFGPVPVDSGTANSSGGCDYVIGSAGFPEIIKEAAPPNRDYPFDQTVDSEGFYQGPSSIPMSTIEKTVTFPQGNIGTPSVVVRGASYACADNTSSDGSDACAAVGSNFQGTRAVVENMLVSIATDHNANILSGTIFAINESKIFNVGGDPNSWAGPKITFVGGCQTNCPNAPIGIDIRPHNSFNMVNSTLAGKFWVSILGSSDFDSASIDPATVAFWPGGAAPTASKFGDTNSDGISDLLIQFNLVDTAISCGDTEGTLTGKTFDNADFVGKDSLTVTHCLQCTP